MGWSGSEVEALDKVHVQMDMVAQVASRNMENDLGLSNPVAMVGKVAHANIDFHTATADESQDTNMHVDYNQNSVEEIQEPYLHLPEANFFLLPLHTTVQLQAAPL